MRDSEKKGEARQIEFLKSLKWEFDKANSEEDFAGTDLITTRNCNIIPDRSKVSLRIRERPEYQNRREISLSVSKDQYARVRLQDFETAGSKWRVHTFFNGDTYLIQFPSQEGLEMALASSNLRPPRFMRTPYPNGQVQYALYMPLTWWPDRINLGNLKEWEIK